MCDYNSQKVAHTQFIRLKGIEKFVANYDFLNTGLHDGFAYGYIAMLKPMAEKLDFEIVQREWGFIPPNWKDREEVKGTGMDSGMPGVNGGNSTLNATHKDMLLSCEYWMANREKK